MFRVAKLNTPHSKSGTLDNASRLLLREKGTPTIVSPVGVAGLEFRDEADTVKRAGAGVKARGVEAIVVADSRRWLSDRRL